MAQANVNIDVTEIWLDPEVDEVVAEVVVRLVAPVLTHPKLLKYNPNISALSSR